MSWSTATLQIMDPSSTSSSRLYRPPAMVSLLAACRTARTTNALRGKSPGEAAVTLPATGARLTQHPSHPLILYRRDFCQHPSHPLILRWRDCCQHSRHSLILRWRDCCQHPRHPLILRRRDSYQHPRHPLILLEGLLPASKASPDLALEGLLSASKTSPDLAVEGFSSASKASPDLALEGLLPASKTSPDLALEGVPASLPAMHRRGDCKGEAAVNLEELFVFNHSIRGETLRFSEEHRPADSRAHASRLHVAESLRGLLQKGGTQQKPMLRMQVCNGTFLTAREDR